MNLGGGDGGRGEEARKAGAAPPGPGNGAAPEAADPSTALSLFEAVERQLGMKLEMHKRPFPTLAVDHVEEKPDN